jgi:hypothetical protein
MKQMSLEIKDFGPINEAKIDLGKITVIAGPNYIIIDEIEGLNISNYQNDQRTIARACKKIYSKRLTPYPFDDVIVRTRDDFKGFINRISSSDEVIKVLT